MDKNKGQIYTPVSIVNMMLDYAGYVPSNHIIGKHVMDNSCGDGRILGEVVKRYLDSCDLLTGDVGKSLATYIHGIEYDREARDRCVDYLNSILDEHGLTPIVWDIKCGNALDILKVNGPYLNKMDFVFGNPPYVRMKNIKKSDERNDEYRILKKYSFAEKGMSDLYLAFYQLGLSMCKDGEGVMCYIAPSAWINSQSGKNMRDYIRETRWLSSVIDFEHIQVFEDATTYVMVTLFDMRPHQFVRYDKYSEEKKTFCPKMIIPYDRLFIDDKMYFVNEEEYEVIKGISKPHKKVVEVKNGYATLADDVFIDNLPDPMPADFVRATIPVVKASTGQSKRCLFPYDDNLNLIPLYKMKEASPNVYAYLMENREKLEKRTYDTKDTDNTWHSIGRSQGLKDTYVDKICVTSLVKEPKDVRLYDVPGGIGVYGGLYIKTKLSIEEIDRVLCNSWEFIDYVKSLRKYKSGGYYTFSSKDLENYLNYKLG